MNTSTRGVFKTRAGKVEKALRDAGYKVVVNKEKPRKGSFVVTIAGKDTPLIELLDMPRPFKKLRELDLDAVLSSLQ